MAAKTPNIGLTKPAANEFPNIAEAVNDNADILDEEIAKRGKTVNGNEADENGNYQVDEVAFAQNLVADDAQQMSGEFLFRTTGGDASLSDGDATLVSILGRRIHTGAVEENIAMNVTEAAREDGEEGILAEIDRDTFVAYVSNSGTITLSYTNAWSANPALYGVTVTGTPKSGDQIQIVYVKEDRGTITPATPSAFRSTGWNLYNNSLGYARVKKYSDSYGFLIGGTYTAVKFSTTVSGTKSTITPVNGYFSIPSDGYVFVTGGNATDTYILMTWSDWTTGYDGDFAAYTEDTISLSAIMSNYFPYGLCQVGGVADEIALNAGYAISRITRMAYSAANLEIAKASGRAWEADTNYIYLVKETPDASAISVSGSYDAYDHGLEIIDGSSVPVFVQTLYGQNLKDKLRTDVLTKSQDLVDNLTTDDATKALSAKQGKALNDQIGTLSSVLNPVSNTRPFFARVTRKYSNKTIGSNGYLQIDTISTIATERDISFINGYALISMMIQSFNSGDIYGLARGSDTGKIYIIGKANATVTFNVQYFFANNGIASYTDP